MAKSDLGIPGRSALRTRSGCGWRAGLLAALGVLLLCAVGALFLLPRQPAYTLPNVTIIDPSDGAQLTTAEPLSVITSASSPNKVTKQELWVDSRLVYVTTARDPQGQERFSATLLWTPQAGYHTLVARALDVRGNVGLSSVVRVNVTETTASPIQNFSQIAQPGDTLASMGKENGVTPENMREVNPGLPEQPAPGDLVNVPPGDRREGSNDDQSGGAVNDPGAAPLPGDLPVEPANPNPEFPGFEPPLPFSDPGLQPPAAPDLNVAANPDCSVTLSWRDNSNTESGFYVYRLVAGAAHYTRVDPSFAANQGNNVLTYTDRGIFGHVDYYVSAFNGAGETASRFVGIDLPGNCMRNLSGQMLEVEAESLTAPGYEETYCYAALKGHYPFERVPFEPFDFLRWISPRVPHRPEFVGRWNVEEHYGGANKRLVAAPDNGQPFQVEVKCFGARQTNEGGESFSLGRFSQSHPPAEWDGRALTGRGDAFTLVYHIRPWTGPGGAGNAPVDSDISAPYGLRRVRDVNDCVAHVPREALLACALANYTDHPPLVWEWDGIPEQIDGYRIFLNRSPVGGTFVPIVDDWPKDARLWPGSSEIPCGETWRYAVAAYDLNVESQRSEFIALSGEECDNLALVEVELLRIDQADIDDGVNCMTPIVCVPLEPDVTTETYGGANFWITRGGNVDSAQGQQAQGVRLAYLPGAGFGAGPVKIDNDGADWSAIPLCHLTGGAGHGLQCDDPTKRNNNKMVFLVRSGDGIAGKVSLFDQDDTSGDDLYCSAEFVLPSRPLEDWLQVNQTLSENGCAGYCEPPSGSCDISVRVRGLQRVGGSRVLPPGGGGPDWSSQSANLQVLDIQRNRNGNARLTIRNAGPNTLIGDTATLNFQVVRVPSGEGGSPGTIWEHEERASLTIPAFGQTTIDSGQVLLEGFENRVRVAIEAVNFTDPDPSDNAGCRRIDVPDATHQTIHECAQ